MQDLPISFFSNLLLRFASSINAAALIPLHVPAPTIGFLHSLGRECDHSTKPLPLILSSQLVDEIVRIMLPAEFQTLREELERVQCEKEVAVANEKWERAASLRDQTNSLKGRLSERFCHVLDVQPEHVLLAIQNLGFDQSIIVESD